MKKRLLFINDIVNNKNLSQIYNNINNNIFKLTIINDIYFIMAYFIVNKESILCTVIN